MQLTNITCDCCGSKLVVETSYPHHYALELSVFDGARPDGSGSVFAVDIQPPLKTKKHFCGLDCLGDWLEGVAQEAGQ